MRLLVTVLAAVAPALAGEGPSLRLAIRCLTEAPRAGDPIRVEFTVTNLGPGVHRHWDRRSTRPVRFAEYRCQVSDASGKRVPDPRGRAVTGLEGNGPMQPDRALRPGASFRAVVTVNRWARIVAPGNYCVVGIYDPSVAPDHDVRRQKGCRSAPLTIRVAPRTPDAMGAYIDGLLKQLGADTDGAIVERLAFTGDARIVPPLVEHFCRDENACHSVADAFRTYLPDRSVAEAARTHGPSGGVFAAVRAHGCTDEQVRALLHLGLADDARHAWPGAALLAASEPADEHAPRLAAIATGWPTGRYAQQTRVSAIRALARHRTDVSVAALRRLLAHEIRWIREETTDAIRAAYALADDEPDRRLLPTDFPALRS